MSSFSSASSLTAPSLLLPYVAEYRPARGQVLGMNSLEESTWALQCSADGSFFPMTLQHTGGVGAGRGHFYYPLGSDTRVALSMAR